MIHNAMHRMDAFLLCRVFQPIAHYIDYRWHVNHFRLAHTIMKFGLVAGIAGSFLSWLQHMTWLGAICLAINFGNIWIAKDMLRRLDAASAAYERDPVHVPAVAMIYVYFFAEIRLLTMIMSSSIFGMGLLPALFLHSYGLAIQTFYLIAYGAALYFAGVIPSGRARKRKKERAPVGLEPVPAR